MINLNKLASFLSTLFIITTASAQRDSVQILPDIINDSLLRFYYDENYFMVDKNCEFKSIERVIKINPTFGKFDGDFKDFGLHGHVVLEGRYKDGEKDGFFKAYHPNGALKWETEFRKNEIASDWKFYYPDSKPMLFLKQTDSLLIFDQFWNTLGQQLIKDGQGYYEMTIPIFGYTEHGYEKYHRTGKIVNGLPDENWNIYFVANDKRASKNLAIVEQYDKGVLLHTRKTYDFEFLNNYINTFSLTPFSNFNNAEHFYSKPCKFDDHINFNIFLAFLIRNNLIEKELTISENGTYPVSYKVRINRDGGLRSLFSVDIDKSLSSRQKILIHDALAMITHYLPSFADGKVISDELIIEFEIQYFDGEILIKPVKITREKGQ